MVLEERGEGKILQQELQDELLAAISLYKEAVEDIEQNAPYSTSTKMEEAIERAENAKKYLFSFVDVDEDVEETV